MAIYTGTTGDDEHTGTSGDDTIYGGDGYDTLYGGAGSDWIYGGDGGDTIYGGDGNDLLYGGEDGDSIYGGDGNDALYGDEGDDTLYGGAGGDRIYGGAGDDDIEGGAGDDAILDGEGDDTLTGGDGADTFYHDESGGSDRITDFSVTEDVIDLTSLTGISSKSDLTITQDGNDALIDLTAYGGGSIRLENVHVDDLSADNFGLNIQGTAGDDSLEGAGAPDLIAGHGGNDTIYGTAGDDIILGGTGDDYLMGDDGADTFVYAPGDGDDWILDFTDGEDKIDLTAVTGVTSFNDLTITTDSDDAVIDLSAHGGGTISIEGFNVTDLDAADFTFYEAPTEDGVDGI